MMGIQMNLIGHRTTLQNGLILTMMELETMKTSMTMEMVGMIGRKCVKEPSQKPRIHTP